MFDGCDGNLMASAANTPKQFIANVTQLSPTNDEGSNRIKVYYSLYVVLFICT